MSTGNSKLLDDALDGAVGEVGEVVETGAAVTPEPEVQPEPLPEFEAPHFWDAQAKDAWKGLHGVTGSAEQRAYLKALNEQWGKTQAYIGKRDQEYAGFRRQWEPVGEFLSPYVQQWSKQGLDPVNGLRSVLSWRDALEQNPQETIVELAQQLGVDLSAVLENQPYVDPQTQALQVELRQLREQLTSQTQASQQYQQQQALNNVRQQFQAFKSQTDADGNLMHPHADRVIDRMVALTRVHQDLNPGVPVDPSEIYRMAVMTDPSLQKEVAEQAKAEALRKAEAQRAAVTQTVQRSGVHKPGPSRGSGTGAVSLDEAFGAAYNSLNN